jgi:hypothetical protein
MKYIQAEIPSIYWTRIITYLCHDCGIIYEGMMPVGNELIKFIEKDGIEERWLPTYEKGGYFDLLENLIPGFKRTNKITVQIADEFENKFYEMQEPSTKGRTFTMNIRVRCPECNSKSIIIRNIETLVNPNIAWMRYRQIKSS